MRLDRPHPIWTTAGSNPYEVNKAIQQVFLSGRYRTEVLARFWSQNKNGYCPAATECSLNEVVEDVEHILVSCIAYTDSADHSLDDQPESSCPSFSHGSLIQWVSVPSPVPSRLFSHTVSNQSDTTAWSIVLQKLFHLARTWGYTIHRKCMQLLGRWNLN